MRDHLEAFERQRRRSHPLLAGAPTLPADLGPLWDVFLELHSSREFTQVGPSSISHRQMFYHQYMTGIKLEPWEVDCIRSADHEYFKSLPKPKKGK